MKKALKLNLKLRSLCGHTVLSSIGPNTVRWRGSQTASAIISKAGEAFLNLVSSKALMPKIVRSNKAVEPAVNRNQSPG